MKYQIVDGNVLDAKCDVLVHQVNCRGVMGSGVAKQIRDRFPITYRSYCDVCHSAHDQPNILLGECLYVREDSYWICNMFSQDGFGRDRCHTDYDAMAKCFENIATNHAGKKIALPYLIGCGLGGGDWNTVQKLINDILCVKGNCDVTLYRYQPK